MSKIFFDFQNIPEKYGYGKFFQDFFKILSSMYIQLLLLNIPLIIISFLNTNLEIISTFVLFPYLQGVSILYIDNYLKDKNYQLLTAFQTTFTHILSLIWAHFLTFLRITIVLMAGFLFISLGRNILRLPWALLSIIAIITVLGFIYSYQNCLIVPHLILLENTKVEDSFTLNWQLIKKYRIPVFFLLFIPISTILLLSFLFKPLTMLLTFISFPFFVVYIFVIYSRLKKINEEPSPY